MSATERVVEIKADLVEIYDTWGLGDEILLGSRSEIAGLSDTVAVLVAALEAVLELHQPNEFTECRNCHTGQGVAYPHPCPTVEAITEALGEDQP